MILSLSWHCELQCSHGVGTFHLIAVIFPAVNLSVGSTDVGFLFQLSHHPACQCNECAAVLQACPALSETAAVLDKHPGHNFKQEYLPSGVLVPY